MPVDKKPSVMMREEEGVGAGKEVGGAQCCCRSGQGAAGARCKPWKHHGAAAVVAGTDVTGDRGRFQNMGAHQSKTRQNSSSNASDGLLLMLWVNHTVQSYNVTPAQAMHQMVRANHTFL